MDNNYLETLFLQLQKKKNEDIKKSYTAKLLNDPKLLAKKIGEESVEVIIEILNKDKDKLINESADLLYHLIVSWIYLDINPKNIWDELKQREVNLEINKKRKTPNGL